MKYKRSCLNPAIFRHLNFCDPLELMARNPAVILTGVSIGRGRGCIVHKAVEMTSSSVASLSVTLQILSAVSWSAMNKEYRQV